MAHLFRAPWEEVENRADCCSRPNANDVRSLWPTPRKRVPCTQRNRERKYRGLLPDDSVLMAADGSASAEAQRSTREHAIRLLARREHSRREICGKLAGRGHAPEVVEIVVDALVEQGLQSDARFVEMFVRSGLARRHGPLKIRAGLRARGVDNELVEAALGSVADWVSVARQALRKRFGEEPARGRSEWGRRARFLAGRGFSSDVVARVLGDMAI